MTIDAFNHLPDTSRLWVYASHREILPAEESAIGEALQQFTQSWTAHDMPLQGAAAVLHKQLVVLALNEAYQTVSGCGIDKSVKRMKELGETYGIDFFNRLQILVKQGEQLHAHTKSSLQDALDAGLLDAECLVFNPMVQTLGDFKTQGFVPLNQFWMAKQLRFPVSPI